MMAKSSSNFFECSSIQSSYKRIEASQFTMAILECETGSQIGEGLTSALCEAVISPSSVHSSSYRNYRWGIVVVFWPKHGLRSDLRVPKFSGGACPQTPPSLFALKRTLIPSSQWRYKSKIAGYSPA